MAHSGCCEPRTSIYGNVDIMLSRHLPHSQIPKFNGFVPTLGETRWLILDPHFTGADWTKDGAPNLALMQQKGYGANKLTNEIT